MKDSRLLTTRELCRFLFLYLKPQGKNALLLAFLLLLGIGANLINPQIIREFVDAALEPEASINPLVSLAIVFLGIALSQQLIELASAYLSSTIAWRATNSLRAELLRHCLKLDMSYHNNETPGGMIERIDGDANRLGNFFSQFIVQVTTNALLFLGVVVMLFREHWQIGLAIGLFCGLTIGILIWIRNFAVPHWNRARETETETFGFIEERLAGTEDIRSLGAKEYVLSRFFALNRKWFRASRMAWVMSTLTTNTSFFMQASGLALGLAIGSYFYFQDILSIGGVFLISQYFNLIWQPLNQFAFQLQELQQSSASIQRIQDLQNTHPTIKEQGDALLPDGRLSVEFQNAQFSYDTSDPVLPDLSFRLDAGRSLGLIGRTGCGKSTIAKLLFRLYDLQDGCIRIGETPIKDVQIDSLRSRIAMVTQSVQLFQGTIRDNLTFFDSSISDERIREALERLELSSWLADQPDGLDTEIVDSGKNLSAGEGQLLAFARVFLREADIVILDEASSKLDRSTERLINRATRRLIENRTAIIIAHHMGTLEHVDDILLLEKGEVVESGTRRDLSNDPESRFSQLLEKGMEDVLS